MNTNMSCLKNLKIELMKTPPKSIRLTSMLEKIASISSLANATGVLLGQIYVLISNVVVCFFASWLNCLNGHK